MKPMNNTAYWPYLFGTCGGILIGASVGLFWSDRLDGSVMLGLTGLACLSFGCVAGQES